MVPRNAALAVLGTVLGSIGASLAAPPTALAESATSPTGLVSVSVPPPVVAGAASTYRMTVTNTSSSPLTNIVALGNLPSGMTLHGIGGCARLGGNQSTSFDCSLAALAPGASETATFSLLAATAGSYEIPFNVVGGQPIPDSPGALQIITDAATLTVDAQAAPTDIQVTGSANNGSPSVGSTFDYTFQVKNNGPFGAAGVTFDDALPPSILLGDQIAVDNGSCTLNPVSDSVHCDVGNLAVGQQSTIAFSATPQATGVFANTATVSMTAADRQPANNAFTVSVQPR